MTEVLTRPAGHFEDWDWRCLKSLIAVQAVFVISWFGLPKEFTGIFSEDPLRVVKNWYLFICVAVGLWGGLIIGLATEYFTSNRYQPVQVSTAYVILHNEKH